MTSSINEGAPGSSSPAGPGLDTLAVCSGGERGEAFTPGPWMFARHDEERWRVFGTTRRGEAGGYCVADVINGNGYPENIANARLIAAAPTLYEALVDVLGWIPGQAAWHTDAPMKAVERARAALALARGESQ